MVLIYQGPFLTIKAFMPQLRQSDGGRIVNLTSGMGSISGTSWYLCQYIEFFKSSADNSSGGNVSYRTAKAALNQITVSIARELKAEGIVYVALTPGWVKTKISSFTGHMEPQEAVEKMMIVIDSLTIEKTGNFFHRDGHTITW